MIIQRAAGKLQHFQGTLDALGVMRVYASCCRGIPRGQFGMQLPEAVRLVEHRNDGGDFQRFRVQGSGLRTAMRAGGGRQTYRIAETPTSATSQTKRTSTAATSAEASP